MNASSTLYHLKERLGIPFYLRPQSYRVTLDLLLENRGEAAKAEIIVPIPQTRGHQRVEEESFSRLIEFFDDERFGNRVGIWKEEIVEGGRVELRAEFTVVVGPIHLDGMVRECRAVTIHELQESEKSNRFFESADAREIAISTLPRSADTLKIARAFNEYVLRNFTYGNPIKGLYSAHEAFEKRVVDCGGFDSALCSLCVVRGIPARIVSGFWAGHEGREMMHAWCEFLYQPGCWIPADPAIEHLVRHGRDRTKSGRFGFVGSDRITFSVGCDIPLPGGTSVGILQHPFLLASSDLLVLMSSYHAEIL